MDHEWPSERVVAFKEKLDITSTLIILECRCGSMYRDLDVGQSLSWLLSMIGMWRVSYETWLGKKGGIVRHKYESIEAVWKNTWEQCMDTGVAFVNLKTRLWNVRGPKHNWVALSINAILGRPDDGPVTGPWHRWSSATALQSLYVSQSFGRATGAVLAGMFSSTISLQWNSVFYEEPRRSYVFNVLLMRTAKHSPINAFKYGFSRLVRQENKWTRGSQNR